MAESSSGAGSRTFKLLVLPAVAAFVLPLAGSQAATPSAGTISESSPSVSWSGDNHTPTAASCDGPNDAACDNFKLTIAPPSFEYQVVDRKSTRLNSSHLGISYAVFCLKKKKIII